MSRVDESHTRLVLASRSPRRARMLREAGYRFAQIAPDFDDPAQPTAAAGQSPQALAGELAKLKAISASGSARAGQVVLGADTLCVDDGGQLLGTPTTRSEARAMLERFISRRHDIITGVALLVVQAGRSRQKQDSSGDPPAVFTDTAVVAFGPLDDDRIESYLDTDQWRDKAGGYNLADRLEAGWPITVEGDATTVMGLPMMKLRRALEKLGIGPSP